MPTHHMIVAQPAGAYRAGRSESALWTARKSRCHADTTQPSDAQSCAVLLRMRAHREFEKTTSGDNRQT